MKGKQRQSLDARPAPRRAVVAARTLLEAYHLQDRRERLVRGGRFEEGANVGDAALERMGAAYVMEFPDVDRDRARRAGEAFMRSLFVQDEIENWDGLRANPERDLRDVLLSDPAEPYGPTLVTDPRWEDARAHLREACREVGIDERYAERQVRFWLLHGQGDPGWKEVAFEAHELKLRSMVDDPPEEAVVRMGNYFVEGVELHDQWSHRDGERDVDRVADLVTDYYRELFELRSQG